MTIRKLALLCVSCLVPAVVATFQNASLSGVVIDEATGAPIRRAVVQVSIASTRQAQGLTTTDDKGHFTLSNLPSANLTLIAGKAGFVTTYYGATKPGATAGVPIALANGQQLANITLKLARGGVITGTLSDETGRPFAGVSVRVQQSTVSSSGTRTLTTVAGLTAQSTDDLGRYRFYGLPPGEYVVSAQPRDQGASELLKPTEAELRWAEQQLRSSAATTPSNASAAPPAGQPRAYAEVFYPGTAEAASATPIAITPGAERVGIDLRLGFVTTARVDGTVTGADGQPASGISVTLVPKVGTTPNQNVSDLSLLMTQLEVGLVAGSGARTAADGSFAFKGVAPGTYSVIASTGGRAMATGAASPSNASAPLWANADVDVSGQDVSGIALRLAQGMTAQGRFVFEGRPTPSRADVALVLRVQGRGASAGGTVAVDPAQPIFNVSGLLPGQYRLSATTPSWLLATATLDGRDIADTPFEVKAGDDLGGIVITFTQASAEVTGVVYDASGHPTSSVAVLVFPADSKLWYQGSRWLRAPVRPSSDGRYSFTNLLPGNYMLAALTDVSTNDWADPKVLASMTAGALKVTLRAGDKKPQDVRIAK